MSFTGRIDRRTFIYAQIVLVPLLYLFSGLFMRAATALDSSFPTKHVPGFLRDMSLSPNAATGTAWVTGIISLVLIFVALSFFVRRLHDLDFSGWFLLLWPSLAYIASGSDGSVDANTGAILESVLMLVPGIAGRNDHGEDPRPMAVAARAAVEPTSP